MEICRKVQEQYVSEIAILENSDNSLDAFWHAEDTGNDDEDANVETSQQHNINVESTAPRLEQETGSATESADMLKAQIVRKPRSQGNRAPKKMSASSSSVVSTESESDII